jgi:2-dehydropantoate 2-reductase
MKVCVVGAGAIGGLIGARLAAAGQCQVSAVARGATLEALQRQGWRLKLNGELLLAPLAGAGRTADLGPQDLVLIAVKGPAMGEVARQIAPLLGPETLVLPAMNGVPWWFCRGLPGPAAGMALRSVDPDGAVAGAIAPERVIGCVVHASASVSEPGMVEHHKGHGLVIGEPGGAPMERTRRVAALLSGAGFDVTLSERIHYDIWYKLWGNLTTNPVSALTGATADRIIDDPLVKAFCIAAMTEAARIGERIGCKVDQTPEERHELTRKLGAFKTSMLQDAEAGKPLELDAIVGAVRELGERVGVPTPSIDALFGLTRLFARVKGLYSS